MKNPYETKNLNLNSKQSKLVYTKCSILFPTIQFQSNPAFFSVCVCVSFVKARREEKEITEQNCFERVNVMLFIAIWYAQI